MNRLRTAAVAILVVAFATSGIVLIRRAAWGQRTTPPPEASRPSGQSKPREAAASPPSSDQRAQARLAVARKIRDAMFQRYRGGEIETDRYLEWLHRYFVTLEAAARSRTEHIRVLESEIADLKKLEESVQQRVKFDVGTTTDVWMVEYYRLEAEELLARAQAAAGETPPERKPAESEPAPSRK